MNSTLAPTPSALSGIRIVDLTSIVFGPYASLILADYGAEVIKVESLQGDSTRYTGPAYEDGLSAVFLGVNRNKKSIALDLKTQEGREVLLRLLQDADVFMHSIRPQKLAKLGLDPAALRRDNPRLIYAALLGYGANGSYSGMPAYDDIIQGLSGIPDLMQQQTGTLRYMPIIAADKTCALVAAHAILAALFQRERDGRGQHIEIPMYEAMVSYVLVEHFYGRHLPGKALDAGYVRVLSAWRRPYQTADGHISLMPYTDEHWRRFFTASGHDALAGDSRFQTIAARTRHIDALYALTGDIVKTQSTAYWLDFCQQQEIPAARINTLNELEQDPHLQSSGFFRDIISNEINYRFTGNPVMLSNSQVDLRMPPRLGEHSQAILRQLGYSEQQIDELCERHIVKIDRHTQTKQADKEENIAERT